MKPDSRGVCYASLDDIEIDDTKGKNPRNKSIADPDLVSTIQDEGILHPIFVRWSDNYENSLMVVDGRRRLDGAVQAGLGSVPVINFGHISDEEAFIISVQANRNQKTFTPKELIQVVRHLNKMGRDVEDISRILSVHKKTVQEALTIDKKATKKIKEGVKKKGKSKINTRVAAQAASLPKKEQNKIADKIAGKSQAAGLEVVKEIKQNLGLSPRSAPTPKKNGLASRKPFTLPSDAVERVQSMEKAIRKKLKFSPTHKVLNGQLMVLQCIKGDMSPADLFGWENV